MEKSPLQQYVPVERIAWTTGISDSYSMHDDDFHTSSDLHGV